LLSSDQFTEIDEILTRHSILCQTDADLRLQNERANDKLDQLQAESQISLKQRQNKVLLATSEQAQSLVRLESLSNANVSEESALSQRQSLHTLSLAHVAQVQASIKNIYARICALSEHQKTKKDGKGSPSLSLAQKKRDRIQNRNDVNGGGAERPETFSSSSSFVSPLLPPQTKLQMFPSPPEHFSLSQNDTEETAMHKRISNGDRRIQAELSHQLHCDGMPLELAIEKQPFSERERMASPTTQNESSSSSPQSPSSSASGKRGNQNKSSLTSSSPNFGAVAAPGATSSSSSKNAPPSREFLIGQLLVISDKLDELQFVVAHASDQSSLNGNASILTLSTPLSLAFSAQEQQNKEKKSATYASTSSSTTSSVSASFSVGVSSSHSSSLAGTAR